MVAAAVRGGVPSAAMPGIDIDDDYLRKTLLALLEIPSPTGHTDEIAQLVEAELAGLGISSRRTRRGAVTARLPGKDGSGRAVVSHLDTIGAMVRELGDDGRLGLAPIGTWPARSAEGGRVTILTGRGPRRGTVLPEKASGHIFSDGVDSQNSSWDSLSLRVDVAVDSRGALEGEGFDIGDFVAFDPKTEITEHGFVVSRHLDDKAAVACVLAAAKALAGESLASDLFLVFTVAEEIGAGAPGILPPAVTEMVAVDIAPVGPGQSSREDAVTIATMDATGPFDRRLCDHLSATAKANGLVAVRDVFRHYKTDVGSAIFAGADVRAAVLGFGADASHGHERTHLRSLHALATLLALYGRGTVEL